MASRARATGQNFVLASLLATLSYLPYEVVAQFTLVVCLVLFISDPFPVSRLVSVAGVGVVLGITRLRNHFLILEANEDERQQQQQQQQLSNSSTDKSN